MLNHEVGPQLIGRDPRDIGPIWEMLYNGTRATTAAAAGHAMPQIARRGMSVAAISAVDIALWDIFGKSLGEPVWRLLGGRKLEAMPAYASGGWEGADKIGEQLKSYIAKGGFKAVKMRVGAMDGPPHISAARGQGGTRSTRPRHRHHGRCARHLHGRRSQALHAAGRPTATSPGSRSR